MRTASDTLLALRLPAVAQKDLYKSALHVRHETRKQALSEMVAPRTQR